MILAYDRIERIGSSPAEKVDEWEIPAHSFSMPEDIPQIADGRWQIKQESEGLTVIRTWRIKDAARLVV